VATHLVVVATNSVFDDKYVVAALSLFLGVLTWTVELYAIFIYRDLSASTNGPTAGELSFSRTQLACARSFDMLFFYTVAHPNAVPQINWFWDFIGQYCPTIAQEYCSHSLGTMSFCPADQIDCWNHNHLSMSCPFMKCHENLLSFATTRFMR
jgi:hypothetical protein